GGSGGCVTRHLLPGGGAESAPRRPVPSAARAPSPGRTTVASSPPAPTSRSFPCFCAKTWLRDLAHPENQEIAGVLERGLGLAMSYRDQPAMFPWEKWTWSNSTK